MFTVKLEFCSSDEENVILFLSYRVLVLLMSRSFSSAEVLSQLRFLNTPPQLEPSALRAVPSTSGHSLGPQELKDHRDHQAKL